MDCGEVMGEFIEKMVIRGDMEEKHGQLVTTMYSDRLHLYTQSSGSCWLEWRKDHRRYVRRLGCSRRWTGLLLTSSYGQACHEERAEQTPPDALSDKTVKDLIRLLFTSLLTSSFNLDEPSQFLDAFTE